MTKPIQRRRIVRFRDGQPVAPARDELAAEEPLEVRVAGSSLAVTMRTPGDDFDLVAGFCVSEGLISSSEHLLAMRYCSGEDENTYNVIDVSLAGPGALRALARERHIYTTSSCGVCGLASIDAVRTQSAFDVAADAIRVDPVVVAKLPDLLRERQAVFDATGGVHAAGLFTPDGEALCVREDVGRHNAVDKVIGWALREDRLPLSGLILQVSGRASFELVQKAAMAGIPVLSAVSAPSSLAVDLADKLGVTVVGFSRGSSFNAYTHTTRLT